MKASERDDLLVRLDERTNNIWRTVEKMEDHVEKQNGFILTCLTRSAVNSRVIKIISSLGGAAIATKLSGLW